MGTMNLMVNELQSKFGLSGGSASTLFQSFLSYINEQGSGVKGLLERFRSAGLGDSVTSWTSGSPKAISAENVENALGSNAVSTIASRAGLSAATTASALAFMLPKFVQRVAPGGQVPTQLPADLTSWVTAPAAAVASRAREIPHAAERAVEKIPGRRVLWPILALIALLLLAVWLWNRRAAVTNTAFNATDEIRMATERADSALGSLRPGFTAQDLVSALNMGAINFATGSSQIPQESFDYLNRAATAIKAAPTGTVIEVGGHTDNSGDSSANLQLSQARAEAVRNYLISPGVDPTAVTAQGYGDSRPLASNDTEEGRFRNRRIQFTVLH
jgi:outer membrane protein OmpA-like peptidoglycan-associated protein/uncharacterized protein YidB (DUF937 family)